MTNPENVYNEALRHVFRLMDLAVLGDTDGMTVVLDEITNDPAVARQVIAHALGLVMGVAADHYPGGAVEFQDNLKRKFGA